MSSTRKSWYRPRNLFLTVAVLVVAFIAWVLFESWPVHSAQANPATDYRAAMHARTLALAGIDAADGEEAWIRLRTMLDLFEQVEEEAAARVLAEGFEPRADWDNGAFDYGWVLGGPTIRPDADRERRVVAQLDQHELFDRLAEYAAGPVAVSPPASNDRMPALVVDPEGARLRHLAKATGAAMRFASTEGDLGRQVAAFGGLLALGEAAAHRPGMIGMLVGMAIQALAMWELRYELVDAQLDEDTSRRLLAALDEHALPPIDLALEAERHVLLDHIQWMYSDDGLGDGYLLPDLGGYDPAGLGPPEATILDAVASRFWHPTRAETVAIANAIVDDARVAARSGDAAALDSLETSVDASGHSILRLLVPSFDRAVAQVRYQNSVREGLRIMLALEIHHARHDAFPETLDELAPSILDTLPVDAIHGGTYGYRRLTGDPHGRGYLLYSFGLDATDDGGNAPLHRDNYAYNDEAPAGIDAILNPPRPAIDE